MIVSTAVICMALNIYFESRSEPIIGQYAVAMVTRNRAGHDESRVCAEVFKPFQFSWANSRVVKVKGGWKIPASLEPTDTDAWDKAVRVATMTLQGRVMDITNGSTYYHTKAVHPAWRLAFERVKSIGAHVFYRDPARQSELTAGL